MSQPIHKDRGWRLFVRSMLGRSYSRAVGYQRQPSRLVIDVGLPLIALVAYVYVYRAIHAPEEFVGFVILGGAMTAFWLNVLWSMAYQFFWEKQMGNLSLYIMAPASLKAILLGMALGGMIVAMTRAVFILIAGSLLFRVHYTISSVPMLILVFVLMLTALYAMGMMFASLFLFFGREGMHLTNLFQEPVYLLSGMYFPIRSLNSWVAGAASLIPLTLGLDAIRQLVFANQASLGFLSPKTEALALLGLTIAFGVGSHWSLRFMEQWAIEDGRLTESRN